MIKATEQSSKTYRRCACKKYYVQVFLFDFFTFIQTYIHTYHSRVIPEGVAEVSQIFLQETNVLPKLFDKIV
jgi:hypothetical protein